MLPVVVAAALGAAGLLLGAWLFARSLLPGATPLVHRFAQTEDPALVEQPVVQTYLRWLTLLWAVTLLAGGVIVVARIGASGWLAGPLGLVAPLGLALTLFFGERVVRRQLIGPHALGRVARQWQIASAILKSELRAHCAALLGSRRPVFRSGDRNRPLLIGRGVQASVIQMQSAAWALAARLPPGPRVLVACDDRALFLWAVLAVWAARRTVVMPPAGLKSVFAASRSAGFDCIVTDRADAPAGALTLAIDAQALGEALVPPACPPRDIVLRDTDVAAIFFTSGTTGEPTAQPKTWRQLADAADAMTELLNLRDADVLLGATVVHSHMFGFEMLVMQPLRGAARVYAHRIVYPSDLAAFAGVDGGAKWLATTPYHLGVFAQAAAMPTGLQRIVSATMPLTTELAAQVEGASGTEVHEIYGSTEAGCIATRRPTAGLVWRLASDLRLDAPADDFALLYGRRVGGVLALRDRIEQREGGFELSGRDTDLVKVAGKRTSLQALTAILRQIDGVVDGVFVDGADRGQRRLMALAVAPQLSGEQIRAALAARIDAAFLPRPLMLVDSLPRDANGKITAEALAAPAAPVSRGRLPPLADAVQSHVG